MRRTQAFKSPSATLVALAAALAAAGFANQPSYQTAEAYVREGEFDRAIPIIQDILATSPRDLKARNLLGIALSSAGRREEANLQFRKALEIDPAFAPVFKNLALNELALGQYRDRKSTRLN